MLMPKRVKYRKSHRDVMRGVATRGNRVAFGDFGLMSLEMGWLPARQIEAGRIAASHMMGTEGRLFIRVFPHKSVTGKPAETRMGKGKGDVEYWAACIRPGTILYEIGGVTEEFAIKCFNAVAHKMSLRCKLVKRHG